MVQNGGLSYRIDAGLGAGRKRQMGAVAHRKDVCIRALQRFINGDKSLMQLEAAVCNPVVWAGSGGTSGEIREHHAPVRQMDQVGLNARNAGILNQGDTMFTKGAAQAFGDLWAGLSENRAAVDQGGLTQPPLL